MEKTVFIPGPDPKLDIVYSDVWLPGLYSRRVFVFELPSTSTHEKAIAVLEKGLKALVEGTPELGGQSVVIPEADHDGKIPWRAIKPYKGIELVVKDLTKTFPSFAELELRGYPLAAFKDDLLMPVPATIEPEPQPQSKFQVSLIEGGMLLSTCIYHHLTDGNGMNTITRALAQACNLASSSPSSSLDPVILNTSRQIMSSLNGTQTDLSLHPAHSIMPGAYAPGVHHTDPDPPSSIPNPSAGASADVPPPPPPPSSSDAPPAIPSDFVPGLFRLTNAKASLLKSHASALLPVSTHDAISALIWRTVMLARQALGRLDPETSVVYTFPHNSRRHVGLSPDWVGNCVYFCLAETKAQDFVAQDSLAMAAKKIREALNTVDAEKVAGIMSKRREDPYGLVWWPVGTPDDPKVHSATSFYHSGLLGVDWGKDWGTVKHFTTTDLGAMPRGLQRVSFVGPKLGGEQGRGCDVLVGADEEELEYFKVDEVWGRYFEGVPGEPLQV